MNDRKGNGTAEAVKRVHDALENLRVTAARVAREKSVVISDGDLHVAEIALGENKPVDFSKTLLRTSKLEEPRHIRQIVYETYKYICPCGSNFIRQGPDPYFEVWFKDHRQHVDDDVIIQESTPDQIEKTHADALDYLNRHR